MSDYLYNNNSDSAECRLRGLEAIEDASTIEQLRMVGPLTGWQCLEVGAGAGSIARWLAASVGVAGRVVATDIDTRLLDPSAYEVWRHDIQRDDLPRQTFDLVHLRHVLIHLDAVTHPAVLRRIHQALKSGGTLLVEESDLSSWRCASGARESLRLVFSVGVDATLSTYRARGMNVVLGAQLDSLVREAGFAPTRFVRRARRVTGGSDEAMFHQVSATQLASSIRVSNPDAAEVLDRFALCLSDSSLEYETRTTISVAAVKTDPEHST
jgi:2-polyprenyl-3-methyl-5-hydroxy-6-metoxy-1,4-benzoquinol methylase